MPGTRRTKKTPAKKPGKRSQRAARAIVRQVMASAEPAKKPARSPRSGHVPSKRRRKGRPSKIERADVVETFFEYLEAGNFVTTAASAAGLNPDTVHEWVRKGEAGDPDYVAFAKRYKGARERAETSAITQLRAHFTEDAAAIKFFLERGYPHNWARKDQLKLTGSVGGASGPAAAESAALLAAMTDEELETMERIHTAVRARLELAATAPKGAEGSEE